MKRIFGRSLCLALALSLTVIGCRPVTPAPGPFNVLATETFLADIAQNVAGDRLTVHSLLPIGLDPHAFELTPQDRAKIADSQVLIINGAGFESWLTDILGSADGAPRVIDASAGLSAQTKRPDDPHFWLDPNLAVRYVENIRAGLTEADPAGRESYGRNADAYVTQLQALDGWIREQVAQIPPDRRLLVTNHASLGHFADRYGFEVVGAVIPGVSTDSSPSAQQLGQLTDALRAYDGLPIFLEIEADPRLAEQLAQDTGSDVVADLYTHSLTAADGPAPTYIAMLRHNVEIIVKALK